MASFVLWKRSKAEAEFEAEKKELEALKLEDLNWKGQRKGQKAKKSEENAKRPKSLRKGQKVKKAEIFHCWTNTSQIIDN